MAMEGSFIFLCAEPAGEGVPGAAGVEETGAEAAGAGAAGVRTGAGAGVAGAFAATGAALGLKERSQFSVIGNVPVMAHLLNHAHYLVIWLDLI